ncbi:hypothetical protein EOS_16680 [Caballeronia mineralivorans PML1(12)]|uniref:3-phosphoglycerate dehydrogenase n=1 Tax=Caballeronia mineralivorans PML1(12) TaxID=908627 RepID=A0A0J1CXJ2_9BURK|nr:hydroxyacid dehydrogenase [Caballeronia mineralivorans]KLU25071.1 hypothetical protein EOS_16680 [Caballeronia mineralivorans PML1(12)]
MTLCLVTQQVHRAGIERLAAAGIEVRFATSAAMDTVAREIRDADAVITRDAGLDAHALDCATRLLVVANHGSGTNKIDVQRAHRLGIPVVFTPNTNARSVAEHTLMLMLAVSRRAITADAAVRQGNWGFRFEVPMCSLYGKTLGIVGFGAIGRMVAAMAVHGLGMSVLVWSPHAGPVCANVKEGVRMVATLDELLQAADVVSLHRPARPDTRHTLDRAALERMKPGAIVVNTSRGMLIDEAALADALRSRHLFGAGLDVFETEPLDRLSPFNTLDNVVLAPHVAGSTEEALRDTALLCAEQIIDVLSGRQPPHLVEPAVWPARRRPAGSIGVAAAGA